MILNAEELRHLCEYDPDTGFFRWREKYSGRKKGETCGHLHATGYVRMCVKLKTYPAHRLAWLYVHGVWPEGEVDHINHIKTDNRICNLRAVSKNYNQQNRWLPKAGKKYPLGVSPEGYKFRARIRVSGKLHYLGAYYTIEEAHKAYLEGKKLLHPGSFL